MENFCKQKNLSNRFRILISRFLKTYFFHKFLCFNDNFVSIIKSVFPLELSET